MCASAPRNGRRNHGSDQRPGQGMAAPTSDIVAAIRAEFGGRMKGIVEFTTSGPCTSAGPSVPKRWHGRGWRGISVLCWLMYERLVVPLVQLRLTWRLSRECRCAVG